MKSLTLEEYDTILTDHSKKYDSRVKRYTEAAVFASLSILFTIKERNPEATLEQVREEIARLTEAYSKYQVTK